MGRKEDSKSAIRALSKHIEVVDESCYVTAGQIDDTPENESAITALEKNRLAYYVDDNLGVQVHSKVRSLLDHVTSRYRFREKVGAYSSLIEDLEFSIESYKKSKIRTHTSHEQYFDEIREIVMEIMDMLTDALSMYHHIVSDEFSVVSDIDERIRQTTRCKDECFKLRTTISHLSVVKIREWVGTDLLLERLLMKVFKAHLDRSLKDLAATNRKLNSMVEKLQRDKAVRRLNKLIDIFSNKFKEQPGYRPDISGIMELPTCASLAERQRLGGYVDTSSARDEELLMDIALDTLEKVQPEPNTEQPEENNEEIADARGETLENVLDPLTENVELLFQAITDASYKEDISAMNAYGVLGVEALPEDWMIMVMSYYEAQKKSISRYVTVEEVRDMVQPFDGTLYIKDMIFRKGNRE